MMTKILFRATGLLIMLGTFAACEVKLFCNGFGSGVYGRGVRPVTD